jgi:hypothetical protein
MFVPTKKDLNKIKQNVNATDVVRASVCGGGGGNCTCGGGCNAPISLNNFNTDTRIFI